MNEKTINRKKERKQIRKSSYEDEKSNDIGTVKEKKKEKKVREKALSIFCRLKYIIENGKTLPVKICKCTDIKQTEKKEARFYF